MSRTTLFFGHRFFDRRFTARIAEEAQNGLLQFAVVALAQRIHDLGEPLGHERRIRPGGAVDTLLFDPEIAIYSVTNQGNSIVSFTFTLEHFHKFFTDPDFLLILWRSIGIALKTTVICVLLGYPVAYFIANSSERMQNILILAITVPTWINMLVRTYAWIGLLSDGGIFQSLLKLLGFGEVELMYTEGAVMLGMVYNFIPFMILQINTSLCKMDHSLLEASADLGANKVQTFWRVTFPLSLSGVISGIALVFLPAVSSFFIPKLLGGGQFFLIGNVIENQFITVGEWNFGSAISMIMAAIMMLCMYLIRRVDEHNSGGRKKRA